MDGKVTDKQRKELPHTLSKDQSDIQPDSTIIMKKHEKTGTKKIHAALVIIEGVEIGRHFLLIRTHYTIGRSSEADIAIKSDPMVSRLHSRIESIYDQKNKTKKYLLTDLESNNHTYVNGHKVSRHDLAEGDKIHIGETTLKFVLLDDIDARFHKEIQNRIRYDSLTSLLTKESFYIALESELAQCIINGLPLSVLMMDIDFFRKVNDTYGHQSGSHVLSEIGHLIKDNLRDIDLSARYGGEEFITYLLETTGEQAFTIAERLRFAIEDHVFVFDDMNIKITISIGISHYPEDGKSIKELVAKADQALYHCKHTGRNKVCLSLHDDK